MILGFLKQRWIFLLSFCWKFVEMFWNSMEDVDDINGTSKYFREYLIYDFLNDHFIVLKLNRMLAM